MATDGEEFNLRIASSCCRQCSHPLGRPRKVGGLESVQDIRENRKNWENS